jgi:hypothetical protein
MYLSLLCSYLLYNTTTKGTVYVHTQARMRGDAVPLAVRTTPYLATSSPSSTPSLSFEGFWPGRQDQCAVRIVRSPTTMSIAFRTDGCCLDLSAVVRLLPGVPFAV